MTIKELEKELKRIFDEEWIYLKDNEYNTTKVRVNSLAKRFAASQVERIDTRTNPFDEPTNAAGAEVWSDAFTEIEKQKQAILKELA